MIKTPYFSEMKRFLDDKGRFGNPASAVSCVFGFIFGKTPKASNSGDNLEGSPKQLPEKKSSIHSLAKPSLR